MLLRLTARRAAGKRLNTFFFILDRKTYDIESTTRALFRFTETVLEQLVATNFFLSAYTANMLCLEPVLLEPTLLFYCRLSGIPKIRMN